MIENIDHILATLGRHQVDYLLIGGVNFLLRHAPVLTYDVDVWIEGTRNKARVRYFQDSLGKGHDDRPAR